MNALHCLAEAFTWLLRPGIRRYTLLPLCANIIFFGAGSYAAWHYGDPAPPDLPLWRDILADIMQEIHKALYFLALAVPTLVLALLLPPLAPVLWFAYAAWCAALQYLDYPMANNGIPFHEERRLLRQRRGESLAYGGAVSLMTTVPVLNLIAMPVGVIAATLYWVRHLRQEN